MARIDDFLRMDAYTYRRPGLTVLELLISFAIIALLVAIVLPAVQSARESARHAACLQNLHEIGLALHGFHDINGSLPPGWQIQPGARCAQGWASLILPQLGDAALANSVCSSMVLSQAGFDPFKEFTPPMFLCPSDVAAPQFALFAEHGLHESMADEDAIEQRDVVLAELPQANYVAVFGNSDPDDVPGTTGEGPFIENSSINLTALTRGTSHVLFVGERTARKLPSTWIGFVQAGEDAPSRVVGYAMLGPNRDDADECEFDSRHPNGANFLWGDGHVTFVSQHIGSSLYQRLARRH